MYKKDITIESDQTLDVTMEKGTEEDCTYLDIDVRDHKDALLSNVSLDVYPSESYETRHISSGQMDNFQIWPGVMEEFTFRKDGYQDVVTNFMAIDTSPASLEAHMYYNGLFDQTQEVRQVIFNKDEKKEIDLGYLASGENYIVGISPLKFYPYDSHEENNDYTYTSNVSLTYEESVTLSSNLIQVRPLNNANSQLDKISPDKSNWNSDKPDVIIDKNIDETEYSFIHKRELELYNNYQPFEGKSIKEENYSLGDKREFWYDFYRKDPRKINAYLKQIGQHSLIYVEDSLQLNNTIYERLSLEFDTQIYDNNLQHFSTYQAEKYDWDKNGKLIILIYRDESTLLGGYFDPVDYSDSSTSNRADMVYINGNQTGVDMEKISLLPFSSYTASMLFSLYSVELFGQQFIKDVISSHEDIISMISRKYRPIDQLYLDWVTANYITDYSSDSRFSYNEPFGLIPGYTVLSDITKMEDSIKINQSAVKYYRIEGNNGYYKLNVELPEKTGLTIMKFRQELN